MCTSMKITEYRVVYRFEGRERTFNLVPSRKAADDLVFQLLQEPSNRHAEYAHIETREISTWEKAE